jgi:isoleucyl-tRNA synthetase
MELLPPGYTNELSPNNKFIKEKDIMDVWFDSGSSWNGVLVERGLPYPSDMYLEGSDQYRGWFNSSMITSVAVNGVSPYKACFSHGFTLDGKGHKMSKSVGNVIDPNKLIKQYGADILRLWASSIDYMDDARISDDIMKQAAENYRKIRNTFRFLLGNLSNGSMEDRFNPENKANELEVVDKYIINELHNLNNEVTDLYAKFDFNGSLVLLNNFINNDLSAFYLDITKDILYCDAKSSKRRLQVQTVLYEITDTLMRLLAPILVHTMDEVYDKFEKCEESVHLLEFNPKTDVNASLSDEYQTLMNVKKVVLKAVEEARNSDLIKSSQEVELNLTLEGKYLELIKKLVGYELERFFIVSKVNINEGSLNALIKKHTGLKCERCWNYFEELKDNMCERCYIVYSEFEA